MTFARNTLRYAAPLLVLLCFAGAAAGCEASVSTSKSLSAGKLERTASKRLTEGLGTKVDVTCNDGIKARKGAVGYCTGVAEGFDGLVQDVRIRITSVKGNDTKFNVAILQKWPAADIDKTVTAMLAQEGAADASISGCDEPQTIEQGRSFTCGLSGVDGQSKVTITFKDDDGAISLNTAK